MALMPRHVANSGEAASLWLQRSEGNMGTAGVREAAPGFEPGSRGFADLCLTTWLCRPLSDDLRRKSEHYHSGGLTRVQGIFERVGQDPKVEMLHGLA